MRRRGVLLFLLLIGAALPALARAQDGSASRIDVFLDDDPEAGTARLFFMDALSGLSTVVNVESGRDFALAGTYVIYEKARTGAIMRANADGTLEPHPFIRRGVNTQAVNWVAAPDQSALAWVDVDTAGVSAAYVARADGSDLHQIPIDTPGPGLRLLPLALTTGATVLFYDAAQPDTPSFETPFTIYDSIAAYQIEREVFTSVPGEPNCPCAASVSTDGRIFGRLEAIDGQGPFALHVWDLPTGADISIPAPDISYQLGGDLLLNDTGTLAAYSVATRIDANAGPRQYGLVLVDIVAHRQTLVLTPGPLRYRAVAFTDGDATLLLTGLDRSGTYKLDLTTGDIRQVSTKTYLGTIELPG